MSYWHAIILAIIEGLTEFLPISSTGHMIITSWLLGIESSPITQLYEVVVQFGAILSVVVLYWRRLLVSFDLYIKLALAFIPTAVLGLLLSDTIDSLLGSVAVVATNLILGGVVLIVIDRILGTRKGTIDRMGPIQAGLIGVFQSISMMPGVSRSAATIIGGQTLGLSRAQAAEFSFLLAIPTMMAASVYKVYKNRDLITTLTPHDLGAMAVGNVVAFVVALAAIKFFIAVLTRHGFAAFGVYRVIAGGLILLLLATGADLTLD